jgi:predicted transcriptional regulator
MLIIAERINASRKYIAQAIATENSGFIQSEAKAQAAAGAHYIDVNAGTFVGEEERRLRWVIEAVQAVTDIPLCIDSPDPNVIRAMLPLVKKTPMINSITLEPVRLEGILPLAAEYGAKVIALCQSEEAMAETADDKVRIAGAACRKNERRRHPARQPLYRSARISRFNQPAVGRRHARSNRTDHARISRGSYHLRAHERIPRPSEPKARQPDLPGDGDYEGTRLRDSRSDR